MNPDKDAARAILKALLVMVVSAVVAFMILLFTEPKAAHAASVGVYMTDQVLTSSRAEISDVLVG